MLRASSSTTSTLRPRSDLVRPVQPFEHLLLRLGADRRSTRCRNSAVSSSSRSGDCTSLSTMLLATVLSRASSSPRQLLAGEDDDRHVAQRRLGLQLLEQLEAAHVRQAQIEDAAVEGALAQRRQRLGAGADRLDLDVVVAEQLDDARRSMSLSSITSSRLVCGATIDLEPVERRFQLVGGGRLDQVGEGAVRQAVLPLLVDRDDLHRDVPRRRVELEVVEHRPAEHVGQEDVERDGGRAVLARQRQRQLPALGDDALEALVARQAQQDARVVRIVLDDQQDGVALADRRRGRRGSVSSGLTTESTGIGARAPPWPLADGERCARGPV